jgi:hypothetical protein
LKSIVESHINGTTKHFKNKNKNKKQKNKNNVWQVLKCLDERKKASVWMKACRYSLQLGGSVGHVPSEGVSEKCTATNTADNINHHHHHHHHHHHQILEKETKTTATAACSYAAKSHAISVAIRWSHLVAKYELQWREKISPASAAVIETAIKHIDNLQIFPPRIT